MRLEAFKHAVRGVARAMPHAAPLPPETWGLTRDAEGSLTCGGVPLERLLERYGSPLYVVDVARLDDAIARFVARPPGVRCEPYFSYKTNPVPALLRHLHARGVGAEVGSAYELWLALELGVRPEAIVFDAPAKTAESLALAIERGVGLINLNGREELPLVAAVARARGRRPRVGLRVVVPGEKGGQFGERVDTGADLEAFREAQRRPELQVVGVHAHLNGEIATREQLDHHVGGLLAFVDILRAELGLRVEVLDVGGNLASRTSHRLSDRDKRLAVTLGRAPSPRAPDTVLSVDDYLARVRELVASHAAKAEAPAPRVFLEPGRAMTGAAQLLACRVASVRGAEDGGLTWALLDAGVNVAEPVPHEYHQLFAVTPRAGSPRLYRLTGPSCTLGDLLYPAWSLPELTAGDALAIMDAGAYFVPTSTCFSFPRPAVVAVEGGGADVWRRAETFEDLVARDRVKVEPREASALSRQGDGGAWRSR